MTTSDLGLKGCRKSVGWDEVQHTGERLLGMTEIISLLEIEPDVRGGARQASQAGSHFRADGGGTGQDPVQGLTCDAQLPGGLADGEIEAGQNRVPQDPARVGRSLQASFSGLSHDHFFS
jgi:hypothetical protein